MEDKRSWRSSVGILQNGESFSSLRKPIKPTPPSGNFVDACIIAFVSTIFFIISFSSPYWLVSYEYTYSDFKNMGLWEFCFDGFRYPKYQFDYKFTGCNYIFANEYRIIWEWLLPVWFMATQTFMSIALIDIIICLVAMSLILVRWPMQFVMRYEWHMIAFCCLCEGGIVLCMFLAIVVFGSMCWTRDWLLNPNYNYLSWSYAFAVVSAAMHAISAIMLLNETFAARERKREANNLLQMEPQDGEGSIHLPPLQQLHMEYTRQQQLQQPYPLKHYTGAYSQPQSISSQQSISQQQQQQPSYYPEQSQQQQQHQPPPSYSQFAVQYPSSSQQPQAKQGYV